MSHVRIDQLQRAAGRDGYAVPHMLGASTEMMLGAIRAAEGRQSPLALGFAPEVFAMVPLEFGLPALASAARHAAIPVATQLEHGHDFDTALRAIRLGVSSVMFDGSDLPYEENVGQTREIAKAAHALGVALEGELGSVGGSALPGVEGKVSWFTEPEHVADFVTRTGVDTLAISFGNVHGPYCGVPRLDLERVRRIRSLVDVPLVMHGGSGLTATDYRRCVESGISNIHFYTSIAVGAWGHLQESAAARGGQPVYHELVGWAIDHFCREAEGVIDMLGSAGHAADLAGLPSFD